MQCSVVVPISKCMALYKTCLTALMTKGAMLSTNATPPRLLFFLESAYIRRVVNATASR